MTETKFDLGEVYLSTRIVRSMQNSKSFYNFVWSCLDRYKQCDWGDIDEEEKDKNANAVANGDRLFASYTSPGFSDKHSLNYKPQTKVDSKSKPNEVYLSTGYGHIKSKIWIITEADRSYTSILFPDEHQILFQN